MKTALIAFDSAPFALILNKMLLDLGFYVKTAQNFNQAVLLCDEQTPDVLLCDFVFEKKPIQELLSKSKKAPTLIIISKENKPEKIAQALDLGATEYIIKPFDSDILQSKLSMAGLL